MKLLEPKGIVGMAELKTEAALALYEAGAIKFGSFRLKLHDEHPDAPLSPFYVDLRRVRSFPYLMDKLTDLLWEQVSDSKFDLLADVPTASTPIVAVLAFKMARPMISPRETTKDHGLMNTIDGAFSESSRVLPVDDLLTNAGSKIRVIETLRRHGLIVDQVAVVVDRGQGGREALERVGCSLIRIWTIDELISLYRDNRLIEAAAFDRCVEYLHGRGMLRK